MFPLDLALAVAGWFARLIGRAVGGGPPRMWYVVVGLLLLSGIPISFVGSSPRPTDLTFDDVRQDHIPAMTSWIRLEGELRDVTTSSSQPARRSPWVTRSSPAGSLRGWPPPGTSARSRPTSRPCRVSMNRSGST